MQRKKNKSSDFLHRCPSIEHICTWRLRISLRPWLVYLQCNSKSNRRSFIGQNSYKEDGHCPILPKFTKCSLLDTMCILWEKRVLSFLLPMFFLFIYIYIFSSLGCRPTKNDENVVAIRKTLVSAPSLAPSAAAWLAKLFVSIHISIHISIHLCSIHPHIHPLMQYPPT